MLRLRKQLTALYSYIYSHTLQTQQAEDAKYWAVMVADQIQRLCPGEHNTVPTKSTSVAAGIAAYYEALAAEYTKPQGVIEPGTSVYRWGDGTISKIPAYPGQKPCGVIADAPVPINIFGAKPSATLFEDEVMGAWEPDEPVVVQTRNGQWSVRYKNDFKVFLSRDEADAYAVTASLPKPVEVPAPTPEPLPPDPSERKRRTIRRVFLEQDDT